MYFGATVVTLARSRPIHIYWPAANAIVDRYCYQRTHCISRESVYSMCASQYNVRTNTCYMVEMLMCAFAASA